MPKPQPEGDERGAGRYAAEDVYTLNDFYIGQCSYACCYVLPMIKNRYIFNLGDNGINFYALFTPMCTFTPTTTPFKTYSHIFLNPGSILDVWGRRYVLTGADRYVLSYVRQHAEEISPKVLSSLATFFGEDEKHEPQIAAEENQ